jgi:serine/threonine-protein kinase HipA
VNDYAGLIDVIRRLGLPEHAETEAFRRMAFNHLAMNCDDHSKNFAFLMDDGGMWRLSPAYDMTFAYNSQNLWLKEHLMGVDGKFSDVTQGDLLAFAEKHGIPYAKSALKEVAEAIAVWPVFAEQAGIPPAVRDDIAVFFTSK